MSPTVQAAIITGAGVLLGALLGAVPTYLVARSQHRMALERLYADKWWDRKEQAYSEIVSSLTSLTYSLDKWQDAELWGRDSEESLREIKKEHVAAIQELERAAMQGSYVVSDTTATALSELVERLHAPYPGKTLFGVLNQHFGASRRCLNIVRAEAESDLQSKDE